MHEGSPGKKEAFSSSLVDRLEGQKARRRLPITTFVHRFPGLRLELYGRVL
jgi:hypothetical protein